MAHTTLLLWDDEAQPPVGDWVAVYWSQFGDTDAYSIPRLVEVHADKLRSRYLAWIHDLGEAHIRGLRLIDHFALRPGFSYWWMTLPASISYGGTTPIYSAVRMLALEGLAKELSAGKVILASGDEMLVRAVRLWCSHAGLLFEWRRLRGKRVRQESCIRGAFRRLPHLVQAAVAMFRHIIQRGRLAQSPSALESAPGKITFVDYLIHLDQKELAAGRFGSHYWTRLIGLFRTARVPTNWVHNFIGHDAIPDATRGRNAIAGFNMSAAGMQFHTTLDGMLCGSVVIRTLRDYARIVRMSWVVRPIAKHFRPHGSAVDLWPFFEKDWGSQTKGIAAFSNSMFLNLFERMLAHLPCQDSGVYLQENQPWEMAFIHAWKAAGHGRLLGVPHSTVLYWDTRYFFDPRSYERSGKNDLPLPDQVALNGPVALATFRGGGFPEDRMVQVEALRYLYLEDLPVAQNDRKKQVTGLPLRVLILGDYFPSVASEQMEWLREAVQTLPENIQYTFKPHPACSLSVNKPSLFFQITNLPLAALLGDCDVVYTSNMTSAAVEAYSAGIAVVSMLDGEAFNMSPLRGLPGVTYVANPRELADALRDATVEKLEVSAYFFLDNELPGWCSVLGLGKF